MLFLLRVEQLVQAELPQTSKKLFEYIGTPAVCSMIAQGSVRTAARKASSRDWQEAKACHEANRENEEGKDDFEVHHDFDRF